MARTVQTGETTYTVSSDGSPTGPTDFDNVRNCLLWLAEFVDGGGFWTNIQCEDGTYEQDFCDMPQFVGFPGLWIKGNELDKRAVKIKNTAGQPYLFTWWQNCNAQIRISNLEIICDSGPMFNVNCCSQLVLENIHWGTLGSGAYCIWCAAISNVMLLGAHTIATGANGGYWALCTDQSFMAWEPGVVVTVTGTPNYSQAFIWISRNATFTYQGATRSGNATGRRYVLVARGLIDSGTGGSPSTLFFPGNLSGLNLDNTGTYI